MNKLKRIPDDWLALGLLICLSLLFFSVVIATQHVFFAGDNLSINVPSKVLFFGMLRHGQLPLWNPYTFSGTPFLADVNLGLLSPFNIFYLFLSPLKALTASIITAILFAGITMYFYGRKLGLHLFGSLTASVIFMFSGSLMTHILNTAVLNTIVWLPLIFFLLECLFQEQKLKYALMISAVLAFSLFGGHIQYFYYIVLLSLAYILVQPVSWKRKGSYIAYIYLLALFLTAIQWVPFLEYASYSTRPVQNLGYAGTVSAVSFVRLIIPNFFGIVKDGTSWGATADINGYIGIIPLILAVASVFAKKTRLTWFFLISALVTLSLALGSHSPIYLLAFYLLPFYSRFRSPAGILVIYSFCLAILAGASAQRLGKLKQPYLVMAISLILLAVALWLNGNAHSVVIPFMEKLNHLKKTAFLTRFLEYPAYRDRIIFSLWFENLSLVFFSVFSFTLVVSMHMRKIISRQMLHFVLFFLILSDLFFFAGNNNIVSTEDKLKTPNTISRFFLNDKSTYRILTYPDPGAKPPFADPGYFENEGRKALDIMQPNTNIFNGIESVGGYASIVRKDYTGYIADKKTSDPTGIALPEPGTSQIDELNVKYILSAGSQVSTLSAIPFYKPVLSYRDKQLNRTISVFINEHAMPRTYLLSKVSTIIGSTVINSYQPNKITVTTQSNEAARLILSEMMYPGWGVLVDGKKGKLETYRSIFRSVPLTAGNHTVILSYRPTPLLATGCISVLNWLYVAAWLAFLLKKQEKVGEELHIGKTDVKKHP